MIFFTPWIRTFAVINHTSKIALALITVLTLPASLLLSAGDSAAQTSSSWTYCATEGGQCNFSGTREVRYGANGNYSYGVFSNGVSCNNGVFGDPVFVRGFGGTAAEGFGRRGRGGFREVDLEEMFGRAARRRPGRRDAGRADAGRGPARHHAHRPDRRGRPDARQGRGQDPARRARRLARARGRARARRARRRPARRPLPARAHAAAPASSARATTSKTTVTVPLTTAVLGGEAQVPTLDGPRRHQDPARVRARAASSACATTACPNGWKGGGRGDLLATLGVDLPGADLTPRERELFEELRKLGR